MGVTRGRAQAVDPARRAVLFLHTSRRSPPGADTWVHAQVLRHLDRRKVDVHLACVPDSPGSPVAVIDADGGMPPATVVPVDFGLEDNDWSTHRSLRSLWSGAMVPWHLARLAHHIRRHRIEFVHTSDRPRDAVAAVALAKLTGACSIVHTHTDVAPWMGRHLRWAIGAADHVVAVSDYVSGTVRANGQARVTTVLNAIDVDTWQPGVDRDAARAELGIGSDETLVLSVCRLYPGKGVGDLIEAATRCHMTHPGVRVAIAGVDVTAGQTYQHELAALIERLGAGSYVQLLGYRHDVRRLMAAADIFAMPSHGEPFGLVYVEAMAMELPVVSLATGGTVEVVEHEVTGLLSPLGDLEALSAHLEQLVGDPDLRRTMGCAGRARAERHFRLERQARDVERLYDRLHRPTEPRPDRGASMSVPIVDDISARDIERCRAVFDRDGCIVFRGVVATEPLRALGDSLTATYEAMVAQNQLFEGGGTYSGHLNCFPGEASRFVWDQLEAAGITGLARALRPDLADDIRVTMNFNLPGSVAQHYHSDGLYLEEFLICNIAVVDTDVVNGALDVLPGTHQRFYRFWEYATRRKYLLSTRIPVRAGDVILRRSTMWHRGMPNHTDRPRPMMAITFGEAAAPGGDPWLENGGRPSFMPNWYKTSRLGRVRERVFVKAPLAYSAYRFVKSLRGNRGYAHW